MRRRTIPTLTPSVSFCNLPMNISQNTLRIRSFVQIIIVIIFIITLGCYKIYAQENQTPKRGFQPGNSYAVSDIETINTSNGNLMLNIPLVSLPSGRGNQRGMAVTLSYNSKLWDSRVSKWKDTNNNLNVDTFVVASEEGGWRYGFKYNLKLVDRLDQYADIYSKPHCNSEEYTWRYKLQMSFPDGSTHEFRPVGETNPSGDDYFKIRPDGWITSGCNSDIPYYSTPITYYSIDGTYLRLEFAHDGDSDWRNNPWTLYLADGSRVTDGSTSQRIYDRNDNYVDVQDNRIVDQLGRQIVINTGINQDTISQTGFNGEQLQWIVKWKTISFIKHYYLGSEIGGYDSVGSLRVIDKIILPEQLGGLSYTFFYNNKASNPSDGWGEISSIILPSGAQVKYLYHNDGVDFIGWRDVLDNKIKRKELISDSTSSIWNYPWQYGAFSMIAPNGGVTRESHGPFGHSVKLELPDGTVIERIWNKNIPYGQAIPSHYDANSILKTEFTSIRNSAGQLIKSAIIGYKYDKNGNVTEVNEYDWLNYSDIPRDGTGRPTGIPTGAVPKRVVVTGYYNSTPESSDTTTDNSNVYIKPSAPNNKRVPEWTETRSNFSENSFISRSEYFYDNVSTTANLTSQSSWDSTKNGLTRPLNVSNALTSTNQYDAYGNRTLTSDAKGTQTQFIYDSINGHSNLYPTEVKTAVGTSIQRWMKTEYDFHTGLPTRSADMDNNISTNTIYDAIGRPILTKDAVDTSFEKRTSTEYLDSARRVIVRSDLDNLGDGKLISIQHYDQLGRTRLSRNLENGNYGDAGDENAGIIVQTHYDSMGRVVRASNPYRSNEAITFIENSYDISGRVTAVTTSDGAVIRTDYDGNSVTATDQAGKKRRSETDALGRLIKVTEDPGGLNYETFYSYDVLGNLVKVIQGSQSRWFAYDSLSRLIRVRNPEQDANFNLPPYTDPVTGGSGWSMAYSYDAIGNLLEKIDARSVKTTMTYDALNRIKSKVYSGTTSEGTTAANATPPVYYYYDDYSTLPSGAPSLSGVSSKGRLLGVTYGGGTDGAYYKYDQLGAIVTNHQRQGTSNNVTTYEYNLSGNLIAETRGDRRKIIPSYDQIGRLQALNTSTNPYTTNENLLDNVSYTSFGAIKSETYGNGLVHSMSYNNRMQPTEIKLGTIASPESVLKLGYIYGTVTNPNDADSAIITNQNNGNIGRVNYYINGALQNSQTYQYDPLNRLKFAMEHKNGTLNDTERSWYQMFAYDRYGNKSVGGSNGETEVWVEDSLPEGAVPAAEGGDSWKWVSSEPTPKSGNVSHVSNNPHDSWSPPPYSGNVSHQSTKGQGAKLHGYYDATDKTYIQSGYKFYVYVYLDPNDVPEQIMLQFKEAHVGWEGWEHRAYWGANKLTWIGVDGTDSRRYMGALPAAGGWVRLEVPASAVGMEGKYTDGMMFTLFGGRANWDIAGVEGGSVWTETVCQYDPEIHDDICREIVHDDRINKVFIDEALPAGSVTNVYEDHWYWSGAKSVEMVHQHYFDNATETLQVNAGDKLYTWVYLDPVNTPSSVMLQWNVTGTWEHRAYWGSDEIPYGWAAPETRKYMGPLPPAGQWVKLEVPASTVGLEGKSVKGMAFSLYGGRAAWDQAGKIAPVMAGSMGVPETRLSYNESNNRITTAGYSYDAAGNLIAEPGKSYTFDGENRIASANVGGATSQYTYDGNGRRVKKVVGSTATRFEYGAGGELIAEYDDSIGSLIKEYINAGQLSVTVENGTEYKYATSDHLGTPRVWTDKNGVVIAGGRHDYVPFGEEIFAGTGTRTTAQGYASNTQADGQRKQFTSKERDVETGLDYFLARYYSSTQGRFVSPDEFTGGPDELYYFAINASNNPTFYADIANPQSLNKYQYTYNSPLRYTDSDGHCPVCPLVFWELSPAPSPGKLLVAGTVAVGAAIGVWWASTSTPTTEETKPLPGTPQPQPAPTPFVPKPGEQAKPQAQPQAATPPAQQARPIDKPRDEGHRKGKRNHDKHTKKHGGRPPNFKPRVPKRIQPPKKTKAQYEVDE